MQRLIMNIQLTHGYYAPRFIRILARILLSLILCVLILAILFGLAVGAIYAYRYLLSI